MEHLPNDHQEDHPNQHKNSNKLCSENGNLIKLMETETTT